MAKVKLDSHLYDRVKIVAEKAGYASPQEFILHILERELSVLESAQDENEEKVAERLRGLGYIE